MANKRARGKTKRGQRSSDKSKASKRPLWLRLVLWGGVTCVALGLLGIIALVGMFYYYGSDPNLPKISAAHQYQPKTVTRIRDRNGILIGELSAERRTVVAYDKIPEVLVRAVVAAEDADFFKHRGLDYMGMLRAFFANLRAGRFAQGGSTITQQVVKTFFLTPRRTIRRKVQEVILARRLESELSKKEILHLYLNQIYFGHGRYGVQEASRFFFGKDVSKIVLAEAALIAGLPQSPERLSPLKHPERAKRRQLYVLGEMARRGYISADVQRQVGRRPIRVVRNVRPFYNAAPEINDIVKAHLVDAFGKKKLLKLGARVDTTVDIKLQVAARDALRWGLRAIDARHGYRRPIRRLEGKRLASQRERLRRSQRGLSCTERRVVGRDASGGLCTRVGGAEASRQYLGLVTAVDDKNDEIAVDLGPVTVAVRVDDERYNPEQHAPSVRFARGDLVRVSASADGSLRFDPGPQGAIVVLEPQTGDVLAMVGAYDFIPGSFNRATMAERQPGSAFKPMVYGAAIESEVFTAATIVDDSPVVFKDWQPRNFDGKYRGPIRVREALAHSINTVAAKVIDKVGVDPVREFAAKMGITTPIGRDLSIALGSASVKVIDLAAAYAAIANGGKRVTPRIIRSIDGETVEHPEPQEVMRAEAAYVLASLMQSVVQEGTGRRARRLRRPVAGKTGTTNEQKDAWFAGFLPQMVAVVWVGFDTPRSIGRRETGGRAALPIWVRLMRQAVRGLPKRDFAQPPGVVVQRIDPKTGLLAPEGAVDALEEYFVAGTEPKEHARPPDEVDPDTLLMDTSVP